MISLLLREERVFVRVSVDSEASHVMKLNPYCVQTVQAIAAYGRSKNLDGDFDM